MEKENIDSSEVEKGFEKIEKQLDKEIKKSDKTTSFFRKNLAVSIILTIIFLFFIVGLFEFSPFAVDESVQRKFLGETCHIPDSIKCTFELTGTKGVLGITSSRFIIDSIALSACSRNMSRINDSFYLQDCNFNTISNRVDLDVTVINPNTGLNFKKKGRVIRFIELTKVNKLFSDFIGIFS